MSISPFDWLEIIDNLLWGYAVLPALVFIGSLLTYQSGFIQLKEFPHIVKNFFHILTSKHNGQGVHPLKAFFTCIGGCMGISNVVAVCTAIQLGGPGALFWIWMTAIAGMILKYSEVYLGLRYRILDEKGHYRGGPMYFLPKVFKQKWLPKVVCLLLCIYGVEIYQFCVVTENISANFDINKYLVALILMAMIIAISRKGVHYIGRIAAILIPAFILGYLGMAAWIFWQNLNLLPAVINSVLQAAFTGHAAIGAFAGSSILLTVSQGMRRSCYAGDVAVGYASVIHSETAEEHPEKQASLAIIEIFLDSFIICTTSVLLVLTTEMWSAPMEASMLVQQALALYFPAMHIFMPIFLLLLGFTTIVAYFSAGIKCAEFLSPKIGRKAYYLYACTSFLAFVLLQTTQALTMMSITAALLLLINLYGIYHLRHEINFKLPKRSVVTAAQARSACVPFAVPE